MTPAVGLSLQPKVALRTLLRMVEVAYDLHALRLFEGWFQAESVPELYELLALLLAQRVLSRCRQGLHRAYRPERAALPYLRGQLQLAAVLQHPARTELPCHFHEYTPSPGSSPFFVGVLATEAR